MRHYSSDALFNSRKNRADMADDEGKGGVDLGPEIEHIEMMEGEPRIRPQVCPR